MQDYESVKLLSEYLLMHYGKDEERMPWVIGGIGSLDFVSRTVEYFSPKRVGLSLDLGCAVGRTSFLLTKTSKKVIGIDFSQSFIDAANTLKEEGSIAYKMHEEGERWVDAVAELPPEVDPEKVRFAQGDAMDLPAGFKGFDRVHASNLLCRLPDPLAFLDSLPGMLADGGELVLATPFSWLEQYTPKEKWPQGDSWEWLQQQLEPHFELVRDSDEPFIIREHGRKFQLGVSKVSLWKKRAS
ncbi:putative 4-mercaptohistidine N1-methyltransferase [Rubritalea marina]|uniref:putative 4-mercaptohistidine N1-methyltransferase n=1 Tax=Rubritalea marina TaxID=361055 RepID=UPI00035DEE92|nr:putative 4-mercaptohistidine N1-methyltransferase [Rubritalea marina]